MLLSIEYYFQLFDKSGVNIETILFINKYLIDGKIPIKLGNSKQIKMKEKIDAFLIDSYFNGDIDFLITALELYRSETIQKHVPNNLTKNQEQAIKKFVQILGEISNV